MAVSEADFRRAILPFTLHYEGGFSVLHQDPGNWTGGKVGKGLLKGTKYGIAASAHPTLDIAHLTIEDAAAIYWRDYVVAPGFDQLDLALLLVTFDAGVNCGPGRAKDWLATAEHQVGDKARIEALTAFNLAYHKRLKSWPRFGKVWGPRIAACQKQALLLAAAVPVPLAVHLPAPAAHTVRAAPKAATQPTASLLDQIIRAIADALVSPQPAGVHS